MKKLLNFLYTLVFILSIAMNYVWAYNLLQTEKQLDEAVQQIDRVNESRNFIKDKYEYMNKMCDKLETEYELLQSITIQCGEELELIKNNNQQPR